MTEQVSSINEVSCEERAVLLKFAADFWFFCLTGLKLPLPFAMFISLGVDVLLEVVTSFRPPKICR